MGMYFQDDFYEAAKELPEKDRKDLIVGLIDFYFTNKEPQLKGGAKAVFIALRERIILSKKRTEAGSKGGSKTQAKAKQNGSKGGSKTQANAEAKAKPPIKSEKENISTTTNTLIESLTEGGDDNVYFAGGMYEVGN